MAYHVTDYGLRVIEGSAPDVDFDEVGSYESETFHAIADHCLGHFEDTGITRDELMERLGVTFPQALGYDTSINARKAAVKESLNSLERRGLIYDRNRPRTRTEPKQDDLLW